MIKVTKKTVNDIVQSMGVPACVLEKSGENPTMWEFFPTSLQYCVTQHEQEIWLDGQSLETMRDQYRLLVAEGYTKGRVIT